jgi:flagellar operon protein
MAGIDDGGINRLTGPRAGGHTRPLGPGQGGAIRPGSGADPSSARAGAPESFAAVLRRNMAAEPQATTAASVKFSAHARRRLEQAYIVFDAGSTARLNAAVDKAAGKGAKDSLILMGDLALVVNIRNRTVVTAVNGDRMRDNVFTNIDSAVIT